MNERPKFNNLELHNWKKIGKALQDINAGEKGDKYETSNTGNGRLTSICVVLHLQKNNIP